VKPQPPTYISWGKRQSDAEPTDVPEPEFPDDEDEPTGPIEIPPAPVPNMPNSIGVNSPSATVSSPSLTFYPFSRADKN